MADKLHFALVSPERELFNGEVDHVVVPGSEGEFGVSPNHAPVMAVIKPGALKVMTDGATRKIFVNGGFADVTPEGLTVLAEEAVDLAEIDPAKLEQELKDAQEDVRDAGGEDKRMIALRAVARLESMRAALAR
ncbi:F0F1 ATP synthase subunit epsilon [Terricaulis sp.]|uniref:F0F1 ATP synthase subunit epsilon n=1 Tax=Terricaulis sp. TaxID=2768686 RepID=UPI00378379A0